MLHNNNTNFNFQENQKSGQAKVPRSKSIRQEVHNTKKYQGRDSPSSNITVFSTSRAFHGKVTNIKLR